MHLVINKKRVGSFKKSHNIKWPTTRVWVLVKIENCCKPLRFAFKTAVSLPRDFGSFGQRLRSASGREDSGKEMESCFCMHIYERALPTARIRKYMMLMLQIVSFFAPSVNIYLLVQYVCFRKGLTKFLLFFQSL